MADPSLPLFKGGANVEELTVNSKDFHFLHQFVFPNLTKFELLTYPLGRPNGLDLLEFLGASPLLKTVELRVIA